MFIVIKYDWGIWWNFMFILSMMFMKEKNIYNGKYESEEIKLNIYYGYNYENKYFKTYI